MQKKTNQVIPMQLPSHDQAVEDLIIATYGRRMMIM